MDSIPITVMGPMVMGLVVGTFLGGLTGALLVWAYFKSKED